MRGGHAYTLYHYESEIENLKYKNDENSKQNLCTGQYGKVVLAENIKQ